MAAPSNSNWFYGKHFRLRHLTCPRSEFSEFEVRLSADRLFGPYIFTDINLINGCHIDSAALVWEQSPRPVYGDDRVDTTKDVFDLIERLKGGHMRIEAEGELAGILAALPSMWNALSNGDGGAIQRRLRYLANHYQTRAWSSREDPDSRLRLWEVEFGIAAEYEERLDDLRRHVQSLTQQLIARDPHRILAVAPPSIWNIAGLRHQRERIGSIYFLVRSEEVVYVGKSIKRISRLKTHRNKKEIEFDRMFYVEVPIEMLDYAERYWIWELRPSENRTMPILRPEEYKQMREYFSSCNITQPQTAMAHCHSTQVQ